MLYFTIALRSKASSANWELVVNNFNNTLSSIFNQTNSEYMVYCACNEIPELNSNLMAYRQKIQFVQVNTPKPNGWLNGVRDRAWKQLACCHAIKQSESKKILIMESLFSQLTRMIILIVMLQSTSQIILNQMALNLGRHINGM